MESVHRLAGELLDPVFNPRELVPSAARAWRLE
jgi:hypothetical protein